MSSDFEEFEKRDMEEQREHTTKTPEYHLMASDSVDNFNRKLEEMLSLGWYPTGNVAVSTIATAVGVQKLYAQMMMR